MCAFVFAYAKSWFSHDMPHIHSDESHLLTARRAKSEACLNDQLDQPTSHLEYPC